MEACAADTGADKGAVFSLIAENPTLAITLYDCLVKSLQADARRVHGARLCTSMPSSNPAAAAISLQSMTWVPLPPFIGRTNVPTLFTEATSASAAADDAATHPSMQNDTNATSVTATAAATDLL